MSNKYKKQHIIGIMGRTAKEHNAKANRLEVRAFLCCSSTFQLVDYFIAKENNQIHDFACNVLFQIGSL